MTQSAPHQPASIQQERQTAPGAGTPPASAEAPKPGLSLGWRVALFIWASAFVCLLAYELLNTLVRSLLRVF
jgi:hypothetical protein